MEENQTITEILETNVNTEQKELVEDPTTQPDKGEKEQTQPNESKLDDKKLRHEKLRSACKEYDLDLFNADTVIDQVKKAKEFETKYNEIVKQHELEKVKRENEKIIDDLSKA